MCVGASAGLAVYGTCALCLQFTSDRQVGLTFTAGGGGTSGATAGVGGQLQISNANNLKQIEGRDTFLGASGKIVGGAKVDVSNDYNDPSLWTGSLDVGPGASTNFVPPFPGGEFHGGGTNTWVLPLLQF